MVNGRTIFFLRLKSAARSLSDTMEDTGLFKQGWKWFQSQKHAYSRAHNAVFCCRGRVGGFLQRHWPMVCSGCAWLWRLLSFLLLQWRDCMMRGFRSFIQMGSAALLLIMWSCFLLSLTSISCLAYVLLSMGALGASVKYLGYTPGLFIVGVFVILILWMYANFWITGTLFMVGGYLFSFNHARPVVLMATIYALYCVKVQTGWIGVFSSVNLAFFSNYALNYLLQWSDNNVSENLRCEEPKESEILTEENLPGECEYDTPSSKYEARHSCKSSNQAVMTSVSNDQKVDSGSKIVKEQTSSIDEMRRILNCMDHYEALGFSRHRNIDAVIMKKEYRKKAILVHPDKNMGSPLASESFKKLQCAYEVLSDSVKKRDYDEHLREEEFKTKSVCHKYETSQKDCCQHHHAKDGDGWIEYKGSLVFERPRMHNPDYCSEESRRIQCTKCGHSHIWVCTSRSKTNARWCQDCCEHHHAKDGDGWIEYKGSLVFERPRMMEIPRAFVCAEGKIFDVSEWAICQGMACRPNTHRPSFHVNMVGLGRTMQRSMSSRFPWDLDAEMMDGDEEEFELWLQQALASGLFCETSKWRKSWSPFKLNKKIGKQWRRTSC